MKRSDIYAAAKAAAILEWGEDDEDAVYVETEARVEGALWALSQVREWAKNEDSLMRLNLPEIEEFCNVKDDK